jgi:hypothetical protein
LVGVLQLNTTLVSYNFVSEELLTTWYRAGSYRISGWVSLIPR